jgi:hypothetical protein
MRMDARMPRAQDALERPAYFSWKRIRTAVRCGTGAPLRITGSKRQRFTASIAA